MSEENQIIVACPMNYHTGGVELLYQLVDCLRTQKIGDSHLFFQGNKADFIPFPDYQKYDIAPLFFEEIPASFSGTIVISEVMTYLLRRFPHAKRFVWWESVDNYCGGGAGALCPDIINSIHVYGFPRAVWRTLKKPYLFLTSKKAYERLKDIKKKAQLNLVQSQYAKLFLQRKNFSASTIVTLSDYINDCYLQKTVIPVEKENLVLYNPKKGLSFTNKLMRENPTIKFVALEGLSNDQMISFFQKAKIYIDFGNHPGKDRMPREAAASMCCVIVGKNGSAKNSKDIPIPEKYKFKTYRKFIPKISALINEIFQNYDKDLIDFELYRQEIQNEKRNFATQVSKIFRGTLNENDVTKQ